MNKLEIVKSRILKENPTHEDWVILRAMLCTLNEQEALDLQCTINDFYSPFIDHVLAKNLNEPSPIQLKPVVRNRSIAAELKDFENYKRGQRTYLRKNLQLRLPYVSYSEQCKILDVFLCSVKTDRLFAYKYLETHWNDFFKDHIQRNFELFPDIGVAKLILRHWPESYLLANIEKLRELCGYVSVSLRLPDEPIDIQCVKPVEYLYLLAKLKRSISSDQAEAILYQHIFNYLFSQEFIVTADGAWSLLSIPDVSLMIWSFGHLRLFESILEFDKLNAQVIDRFNSQETTLEAFKNTILIVLEPYRHYYDALMVYNASMAGEIEEADKVIKQAIIQRFTKENADVQTLLENLDLV